MPQEFDITMLGPRRVGKTSLLASVYHQFRQVGQEVDLQIKPVGEGGERLSSYISYLEQTFDTPSRIPKNNGDLVPPTDIVGVQDSDIQYRFNLGRVGKNPKVQLVFRDFPGGQLFDKKQEVINRVKRCKVTMITVDTPALMFEKSKANPWAYHNERNLPRAGSMGAIGMHEIFQEAYNELRESKLVLLVPIKCEKWVQDTVSSNVLMTRLKTGYELLLNFLASDSLKNNVAVVVTPVQTLGNMEYAHMDQEDEYSPRYLKRHYQSKYEPRDCEQPLRYTLRFVLRRYLQNPGIWDGLLYRWFGKDEPFKKAIDQFAKECKPKSTDQEGSFTVLQGRNLL